MSLIADTARFLRFVFFGAVSYLCTLGLASIFIHLMGIANAKSYALTQVVMFPVNFFLNRHFVFQSRQESHLWQGFKFLSAYFLFRFVDWLVFVMFNGPFGLPYYQAIILGMSSVYPLKFLTYRSAVFGCRVPSPGLMLPDGFRTRNGLSLLAVFRKPQNSTQNPANPYSASKRTTKTTSTIHQGDTTSLANVVVLENHSLEDFIAYLEKRSRWTPALDRLLEVYKVKRKFPDMGDFRLGPNKFDQILLDWIIFIDSASDTATGELIGHGVTTRINWDQSLDNLPNGWQGAVRASYQNLQVGSTEPNTLVGLFIRIEDNFRQHGWAGNVIEQMKSVGRAAKISSLIIPLRPPSRYQKEYAAMPLAEFAALKRDDGQPRDHWVRLHVRLGAKIIGVCGASHQHAFPLKDFYQQIPSPPITQSGYALVQQRDGEWYNVYVDLEREFVLINQGCVWVQHPLRS